MFGEGVPVDMTDVAPLCGKAVPADHYSAPLLAGRFAAPGPAPKSQKYGYRCTLDAGHEGICCPDRVGTEGGSK